MTEKEIYISITISSTISFLGCTFIILLYIKFKELQGFTFKLVAYLALLDLLHCVLFMIPTYESSPSDALCIVQSYFITIITLESVIWTCVICVFIYLSVTKSYNCEAYVNKTFIVLTMFCIVVSLIPVIDSDIHLNYASRLGWC